MFVVLCPEISFLTVAQYFSGLPFALLHRSWAASIIDFRKEERFCCYTKKRAYFSLLRKEGQKAYGPDKGIPVRVLVRQIDVDV